MGRPVEAGDSAAPCYRTKSASKVFEEVKHLVRKCGRKTLCWVDPTWNMDPAWTAEFCDRMTGGRVEALSTAWMRADHIVRDEGLGILKKQVDAGLRQAFVGVERGADADLASFDKRSNSAQVVREAFRILRTSYPSVFTIATLIYGLWEDTEESLTDLVDFGCTCGADYAFFIPLTPNPGTAVWDEARRRGAIEVEDFRAYNFITPVMRTRRCSAVELQQIMHRKILAAWPREFGRAVWQVSLDPDPRRRSVRRAMLRHGTRYSLAVVRAGLRRGKGRPTYHSIVPAWYEK
jgi:magnesium-protoporphyrin IX monomethyl ester (oxidative) cyclase